VANVVDDEWCELQVKFKSLFPEIAKKAKLKKNSAVLNLGCGPTVPSRLLKIGKVTGLDPLAKKLPFKKNSFDVVVMLDVVEHLHEWELEKALFEANRVLSKGGKLLVHTSPNKLNMSIVRAIAHMFGIKLISEKYHVNEQSPKSLKKILSKYVKVKKIILYKDVMYYSKQMSEKGGLIKKLAKFIDSILDSKVMKVFLQLPIICVILSTDIYSVCTKKE